MNAILPAGAVTLLTGEGVLRTWRPETGLPKSFCGRCGGQLYSGEPGGDDGLPRFDGPREID